eukprot:14799902-Alexandrium_andersonii.AAC.1
MGPAAVAARVREARARLEFGIRGEAVPCPARARSALLARASRDGVVVERAVREGPLGRAR